MTRQYSLQDLLYLMQRLRKPESGCPWDLKQDYRSIVPSTVEEVYEVVDCIERGDFAHLEEELGDLLFQVVFYAQLGDEDEYFDFHSIVHVLTEKLLRRHPHVFPGGQLESERELGEPSTEAVNAQWEAIKQSEREGKGRQGLLADVPLGLPTLTRAQKLQKRAAKVGFDWPDTASAFAKLKEEVDELEQALIQGNETEIAEELGDLMFSCVNIARKQKQDADQCLREASRKFTQRIAAVEAALERDGLQWQDCDDATLDRYWQQVKAQA